MDWWPGAGETLERRKCSANSAPQRFRATAPGFLSASAVLSVLFRGSELQRHSASAFPRFRVSAFPRFRATALPRRAQKVYRNPALVPILVVDDDNVWLRESTLSRPHNPLNVSPKRSCNPSDSR